MTVNSAADSSTPTESDEKLEDILSRGSRDELPPNRPKGLLGEKGLDLYATDTFEPDLNAGISQENDVPVVWLGIVLAFLVFFPLAYWLLWRSSLFTRRAKIITSIVGTCGVVAIATAIYVR